MQPYLFIDNEQTGPFEDEEIVEGLRDGTYNYMELGWREGMAEWQPLAMLCPVQSLAPPPGA